MSHINYVVSALQWTKTERDKLDTLMRKSVKKVLGIPVTASTDGLMQLGVDNTTLELIVAQRSAQITRLSGFSAGRRLLEAAGLRPRYSQSEAAQLDENSRGTYVVGPFPRNVDPQYNAGRRAARARAILKKTVGIETFVDAAQYGLSGRFAVTAVSEKGELLSAASVVAVTADVAEQVAVALAMQAYERPYIYTDSRTAVRAFASGMAARQAVALLKSKSRANPDTVHYITWFPAHMGDDVLPGRPNSNEVAHRRARELKRRDGGGSSVDSEEIAQSGPLLTLHEIVSHYRGTQALPASTPKTM